MTSSKLQISYLTHLEFPICCTCLRKESIAHVSLSLLSRAQARIIYVHITQLHCLFDNNSYESSRGTGELPSFFYIRVLKMSSLATLLVSFLKLDPEFCLLALRIRFCRSASTNCSGSDSVAACLETLLNPFLTGSARTPRLIPNDF